jgi:hypothetical protein
LARNHTACGQPLSAICRPLPFSNTLSETMLPQFSRMPIGLTPRKRTSSLSPKNLGRNPPAMRRHSLIFQRKSPSPTQTFRLTEHRFQSPRILQKDIKRHHRQPCATSPSPSQCGMDL